MQPGPNDDPRVFTMKAQTMQVLANLRTSFAALEADVAAHPTSKGTEEVNAHHIGLRPKLQSVRAAYKSMLAHMSELILVSLSLSDEIAARNDLETGQPLNEVIAQVNQKNISEAQAQTQQPEQ